MPTVPERIKQYNKGRLPVMLQIKYKLMTENIFRFYRGTCHLFYEDLNNAATFPESPVSWICGDLHMERFGAYRGDNRQVYFDINDFDEAVLAPVLWEAVRMTTSIFIAFYALNKEQKKALQMAKLFLDTYMETLRKGKACYADLKTSKGIVHSFLHLLSERKQKDQLRKSNVKKKNKLIILMDDQRHFEIEKFLKKDLNHHINSWIKIHENGIHEYEAADAVFRLAGTGSIGVKRYVFLLRNLKGRGKFLLLEMKQAIPSSLLPFVQVPQPPWESEAQRVAVVQERMQNVSCAFLGTTVFRDESYIIQEMQPAKDTFSIRLIGERYRDIYKSIEDMAILTASAQLRSAGRQGAISPDDLISFGQNNQWQEQVLAYSQEYAKKIKKDYKEFCKAFDTGYFKK